MSMLRNHHVDVKAETESGKPDLSEETLVLAGPDLQNYPAGETLEFSSQNLHFSADGGTDVPLETAATKEDQDFTEVQTTVQAAKPVASEAGVIAPALPYQSAFEEQDLTPNWEQSNATLELSPLNFQPASNEAISPHYWQPRQLTPLDPGYYKYLTTPPPVEKERSKKQRSNIQSWWGGDEQLQEHRITQLLTLTVVIVAAILIVLVFFNGDSKVIPASTARTSAIIPTPAPTTVPTPAPSSSVVTVAATEKWAMVIVPSANIYTIPVESGNVTQKLRQNTLVAFDKKSSSGWYMLAGGGWIKQVEVKIFPDQQAAYAAVSALAATATVAATGPGAVATAASNPQLSPQQLSAEGMLTYQAVGCNIKGEISATTGVKIYYVVNQKDYAGLSMIPPETHRWFCSEQDAVKNGYTKSISPILVATAVPATSTGLFPTSAPIKGH